MFYVRFTLSPGSKTWEILYFKKINIVRINERNKCVHKWVVKIGGAGHQESTVSTYQS